MPDDAPITPDAIARYRELRDRIDRQSGRLVDLHCKHLACRAGCHDCCTDFTVSAVEYHAILDDLRAADITAQHLPPPEPNAACAFLDGGLCLLYRFRPLICRTHGLPVVFLNEQESPPQMNVTFCPKNFTGASDADLDFGPENTLDLEELNAELADVNVQFERQRAGDATASVQRRRIPLRQLREDLAR